jgi:hypothetical protein
MWDIRKQIIELLEPFMDKTLSEWCILTKNNELYKFLSHTRWKEIIITKIIKGSIFNWCDYADSSDYKIIWHYDITTLLRYLKAKSNERGKTEFWSFDIEILEEGIRILPDWSIEYCTKEIQDEQLEKWFFFETTIPNKPLSLYSPEEELELLNLLKKLR